MATQSLEFSYSTGQTLTAKLFAEGSDTVVATADSVTEATNRLGRYVAAFTDVPAGTYLLVYFLGADGAGTEKYTLTLSTATFVPWSELGNGAGASVATNVRTELTTELGRIDAAVSSRAATGAEMDLVDSPNSTATASIASAVASQSDVAALIATIADGGRTDLLIDGIKAKTDLIGTGSATVVAPVAEGGQLTSPIIIGDDYLAANGRAFEWTITEPTGVTAGTATCQFGAAHPTKGSFSVTGTITDNGSTWTLSFDVTRTDTADLEPGEYKWSVQVTDDSGNEITQVRNKTDNYKVRLVDKQT